jgi:hypothetical protein
MGQLLDEKLQVFYMNKMLTNKMEKTVSKGTNVMTKVL